MCQEFSASYQAHTAICPSQFKQQPASGCSSTSPPGWRSALNSEAYCSSITQTESKSQKQANCEGSFTSSIDVLCSVSVITVMSAPASELKLMPLLMNIGSSYGREWQICLVIYRCKEVLDTCAHAVWHYSIAVNAVVWLNIVLCCANLLLR